MVKTSSSKKATTTTTHTPAPTPSATETINQLFKLMLVKMHGKKDLKMLMPPLDKLLLFLKTYNLM